MRILLDTHVWLWWNSEPHRLSSYTTSSISDPNNEVFLSAASAWEIAIKVRIGKLPLPESVADYVAKRLLKDQIQELPIRSAHAAAIEHLPVLHKDPFDLLLIAQSQIENLTLFTADDNILAFGGGIFDVRNSI